MKNTKIVAVYRDASGHKQHTEEIFSGEISEKQLNLLKESCDIDGNFIASEVGFPCPLRKMRDECEKEGVRFPTEDDHVFSRFEAIEYEQPAEDLWTDDTPTSPMSVTDFISHFKAHAVGDIEKEMESMGLFDVEGDDDWDGDGDEGIEKEATDEQLSQEILKSEPQINAVSDIEINADGSNLIRTTKTNPFPSKNDGLGR